MKIICFAQEAWEEKYMRDKFQRAGALDIEMNFHIGTVQDTTQNDVGTDEDAEALSIFVNSHIGAAELDRYPKLKLIATRSTGFDHIDLEEAKKRDISIVSVPSYGANTVAEFAFALLLALSRRICDAHEQVSQTNSFSQANLTGFDLEGKTIGIVGCGHIGLYMAKIANGFGMHVLVYDTQCDPSLAGKLNFTYVSLEELLAGSDIISLHVPYNEHTHHLINQQNISQIKKGAYLINTARGAIVETEALVEALKQEIIAGAGLDVLEEEGDMHDELKLLTAPHPKDTELKVILENHYLIEHPHVIITPHIAFDTNEAIRRILDTTAANIIAFQSGTPQNLLAT